MSAPSVFGQILDVDDVLGAVQDTLQLWLPYTLAEVARQKGWDPADTDLLPRPASWVRRINPDDYGDEELPALVLHSPGTAAVAHDGDSSYDAAWHVIVAAVLRADDYEGVITLSALYAKAIRMALVQHGALGGFARGLVWTGTEFDRFPSRAARTLGGPYVAVDVAVQNVGTELGPLTPPVDPIPDPGGTPTADEIDVTVHKVPAAQ